MKNILHVVNISFVIPFFLGDQLSYFGKKGYREHVICTYSAELESLSKKYDFKYQPIDILRKVSLWKDLKSVFQTMKYIKNNHIEVVTGHTPKGALVAMLAAYVMRVPLRIYFRHGLVYETSLGIKRKLMISIDKLAARLATKIVCVSPSVCRRSIEDNLNPISKQCLLARGTCNGIDTIRFQKSNIEGNHLVKMRQMFGLNTSDFVVGFTGRLVRDKGIVELINAFRVLQCKYHNVKLLLVGMLEERDAISNDLISYIQSNGNIINTGYVPNASIEYFYALMDIFVLPSYREGFPTSVLEASAMELPIITTRVTGCIDSIVEGRTGVFVEHSSESIAAAIDRFYVNRNLKIEYGRNGRNFVVENFEQNIIWGEIEKLYQ